MLRLDTEYFHSVTYNYSLSGGGGGTGQKVVFPSYSLFVNKKLTKLAVYIWSNQSYSVL